MKGDSNLKISETTVLIFLSYFTSPAPGSSSTEDLVPPVTVRIFKGPVGFAGPCLCVGRWVRLGHAVRRRMGERSAWCPQGTERHVGRLPVRFIGVVEELREGRYVKRGVGAYGEGRRHETANGFSVRHTLHARGLIGVQRGAFPAICCAKSHWRAGRLDVSEVETTNDGSVGGSQVGEHVMLVELLFASPMSTHELLVRIQSSTWVARMRPGSPM